jgi:hypothetical protein
VFNADRHEPETSAYAPGALTRRPLTDRGAKARLAAATTVTTPARKYHRAGEGHRPSMPRRPRARSNTATTKKAARPTGPKTTQPTSHQPPRRALALASSTSSRAVATMAPSRRTRYTACPVPSRKPGTSSKVTSTTTAAPATAQRTPPMLPVDEGFKSLVVASAAILPSPRTRTASAASVLAEGARRGLRRQPGQLGGDDRGHQGSPSCAPIERHEPRPHPCSDDGDPPRSTTCRSARTGDGRPKAHGR